jgi:hypothetical protein
MGPETKGILYAWATAFIVFGIYQLILWIKESKQDKLRWKEFDDMIKKQDEAYKKAIEISFARLMQDAKFKELVIKLIKEKEKQDGTTN